MALTPYTEDWLNAERLVGGPMMLAGPVEEIRRLYMQMGVALLPFRKPVTTAVDIIESRVPDGPRVRIYVPHGSETSLPVGVYVHGGGWVLGDLDSDDDLCRILSVSARTVLVSVDYRLAPAYQYPAGLDDCEAAYKWALQSVATFKGNKDKFFSIGGSAGGNLAIGMALRTLEWSDPTINKGLIGIAPITIDPAVIPPELHRQFDQTKNKDSVMIDEAAMETFRVAYSPGSRSDPYYSVLLNSKLASLPTTYLIGCGKDPVGEDARAFHQALVKTGVASKLDFYEGYPHYFWNYPVEKSKDVIENLVTGIKWVIASMK